MAFPTGAGNGDIHVTDAGLAYEYVLAVNGWRYVPPTGGSTAKAYASFYLGTGGLTAVAAAALTVVINQIAINSDVTVFSLAGNQVTIDKTGDYKLSFDCYFNNSSTSRTEYSFWLEVNGVEVSGTRAGNYQRGYDSGNTVSINNILSLNAGDTVGYRVQRTDGASTAGYQDDNGTRLTIEEK